MTKKVKIRRESPVYIPLSSNATRYSEGDVVDTPEGKGVVSGVWERSWETDGETVDASSDSPAYTVALLDGGFGHFSASDLESSELPETDVDSPEEDLAEANQSANSEITANDWNAPDSWEESETPVRVIALDTWQSMGGQFDCGGGACCKGTMRQAGMSERASDEFCASFKSYILGTDMWRGWGPD